MANCPPRHVLERLVTGDLPRSEFGPVSTHVEDCPACQGALDHLTAVEPGLVVSPSPPGSGSDTLDEAFIRDLAARLESPDAPGPNHSAGLATGEPGAVEATERDGDPAARARTPLPNVPGYEIYEEIGRGGMGVVYRARQIRLGRPCALKMILAGASADMKALQRFQAEAQTVALLRHPNIVQIFAIGEYEGRPYLELEYLEKGPLSADLDGTPRPPRASARMVGTLARAIAEAHRLGIVHRDLKPSNVLRDADGTPKVADFGLAKDVTAPSGLTATEAVLGSPSYMAPEQAGGKGREAGPAADVYALGAILYELLVGRPPFRAATVLETLALVRDVEPVSPSRLAPGIPRDLVTIVLKCLQKEPPRRYPSAEALADDLDRFLTGRPILGRRVGLAEQAWRWCRRRPALAGLTGLSAAALAGLIVVSLTSNVKLRAKQEDLNKALSTSKAQTHHAQALVAELALDKGIALGEAGQVGPGLLWMAEAARQIPPDSPELEGLIRANLAGWGPIHPRIRQVFEHGSPVFGIAISPDGTTAASGGGDGSVRIWDAATGQPIGQTPAGPEAVRSLAFDPSGHTLLVATGPRHPRQGPVAMTLWDVESLSPRGELVQDTGKDPRVAFSPDGTTIATLFVRENGLGVLRLWEAATLAPRGPGWEDDTRSLAFRPDSQAIVTGHVWQVFMRSVDGQSPAVPWIEAGEALVAYHPSGQAVATGDKNNLLRVWDAATANPLGVAMSHPDTIMAIAFSPDGRMILTGCRDGRARLWDPALGRPLGAPMIHGGAVSAVAFTPDGRSVLTAGEDRTARIWDIGPATGENQIVLEHTGEILTLAVSPDGTRLFVGTTLGQGRLWDPRDGRPIGATLHHQGAVEAAQFSPDGRILLTGGGVRNKLYTARLWDAHTGRLLGPLLGHTAFITGVAISPDGKTAATTSFDHTLRFWDVTRGGAPILPVVTEPGMFTGVTFRPDGRAVLAGHESSIARFWDATTHQALGEPLKHDHYISHLAIRPDGRVAATSSWDGTVKLWDVASCKLIGIPIPQVSGPMSTMAFSPDGRTILVGNDSSGLARFHDVATSTAMGEPLRHGSRVMVVGYAPVGQLVLTVGEDGTLRLWDPASRKAIGPPQAPGGGITRAVFTADGTAVIAACRDATVRILPAPRPSPAPLDRVAAAARSGIGLTLTTSREILPEARADQATSPAPEDAAIRWHEAQAAAALAARDGFAAEWHLSRLGPRGDRPENRVRRASVLVDLGHRDEAAEQIRLALASDPKAACAALEHAATDDELRGEWANVLWYLDHIVKSGADSGEPRARRARALASLGRTAEAAAEIDRSARLGFGAQEREDMLREDCVLGRWASVACLLGCAARSIGETAEQLHHRALALLKAGDADGYRAVCDTARDRLRNDPTAEDGPTLAWTLCLGRAAGDLDGAIAWAEAAVTLTPENDPGRKHQVQRIRGALLHRVGRDAEAIEPLTHALDAEAGREVLGDLVFLGLAHRKLSHETEAGRYLAKARGLPAPNDYFVFLWERVEDDLLRDELGE